MLCVHCGKQLAMIKKLTDGGFCSPDHRQQFYDSQQRLMVERLEDSFGRLQKHRKGGIVAASLPNQEQDPAWAPPLSQFEIPAGFWFGPLQSIGAFDVALGLAPPVFLHLPELGHNLAGSMHLMPYPKRTERNPGTPVKHLLPQRRPEGIPRSPGTCAAISGVGLPGIMRMPPQPLREGIASLVTHAAEPTTAGTLENVFPLLKVAAATPGLPPSSREYRMRARGPVSAALAPRREIPVEPSNPVMPLAMGAFSPGPLALTPMFLDCPLQVRTYSLAAIGAGRDRLPIEPDSVPLRSNAQIVNLAVETRREPEFLDRLFRMRPRGPVSMSGSTCHRFPNGLEPLLSVPIAVVPPMRFDIPLTLSAIEKTYPLSLGPVQDAGTVEMTGEALPFHFPAVVGTLNIRMLPQPPFQGRFFRMRFRDPLQAKRLSPGVTAPPATLPFDSTAPIVPLPLATALAPGFLNRLYRMRPRGPVQLAVARAIHLCGFSPSPRIPSHALSVLPGFAGLESRRTVELSALGRAIDEADAATRIAKLSPV